MKYITALVLAIGVTASVSAQVPTSPYRETFAARLHGGLLAAFHSADFSSSGDIIDCGQLGSGLGLNGTAGAILEFPLTSTIGIGVGVAWAGRSATMERSNSYPVYDTTTAQAGTLRTTYALDASLTYLELQPDVRLALIGDYQSRTLGLVVGPRISLPLTTRFVQREAVVSPANATFIVNGQLQQERVIADAPLTARSAALVGLSAGMESLLPISERISIVPAVSVDYSFVNVLTDAPWSILGVRAEIGIRFSAGRKPAPPAVTEPPPPPPPPPAIIVDAKPVISLSMPRFEGVLETGNQLQATTPIVNAVFFDSASVTIPTWYRTSRDGSVASADAVAAHEWVLPRLAAIMLDNPKARMILEGASGDAVANAQAVGMQRATAVKAALLSMGVADQQMVVRGREMPRVISTTDAAAGREENRRVDLFVENAPLQEWVSTARFAQVRGMLGIQAVRSGGSAADTATTTATTSVRLTGPTMTADTVLPGARVSARIPVRQVVDPTSTTMPITCKVSSAGAAAMRDTTITLADLPRREIDLRTEDFQAVLRFEYNSSELTSDIKGLLSQLSDRLPDGSTITIQGSADALGTQARNRELSQQRAQNTEQFIRSVSGNRLNIVVSGDATPFSDATPQGRFLNRSIRLTVRTP